MISIHTYVHAHMRLRTHTRAHMIHDIYRRHLIPASNALVEMFKLCVCVCVCVRACVSVTH